MQPTYIYGNYPSKLKIISCLLILLFFPVVIANWIEYVSTYYSGTTDISFVVFYLIGFLVLLMIFMNSRSQSICLFYNSFLLYKERLSIKDKVILAFTNKDLEKLEKYLNKYQYRHFTALSIECQIERMIKYSETGLSIHIDLIDTNQQKIHFTPIATKEDYQQFLAPFLQYHVPINDPYHIIDAINQKELRIIDYLQANKKST